MRTLVAVVFGSLMAAGCAEKPDTLVCTVQERNAQKEQEMCGATGCVLRKGTRITIEFPNGDDSNIAVGDIFGARTMLKKKEIEDFSGANLDRNISLYDNSAESPIPRKEFYMLNKISGQLYYLRRIRDEIQDEYYGTCDHHKRRE